MISSAAFILATACLLPCLAEPPSSYLPPSAYSTMNQHSFAPPSFGLTAPAPSVSSTYAALSAAYGTPLKTYGPPVTPRPMYIAPSPAPRYNAPSPAPVYSVPTPAPVYVSPPKPMRSYLPPAPSYSAPKPVYGPAKSSYDDYSSEPAHYEYQYTVHDDHFGTDFGHKEDRQGDVTHGQYMVLLPDGRRQIVEYVADKNGYRPTIRYEGSVKQGY